MFNASAGWNSQTNMPKSAEAAWPGTENIKAGPKSFMFFRQPIENITIYMYCNVI